MQNCGEQRLKALPASLQAGAAAGLFAAAAAA
jgi:hypothetical protein